MSFDEKLSLITAQKQQLIEQGESIIDLSMINPDLPPPRELLDRFMEASLKHYNHRYSVSKGIKKLREGFSVKYKDAFKADIQSEENICICFGTNDAVLQTLKAVTSAGDTLLIGAPYYPGHRFAADYLGLKLAFFNIIQSEDRLIEEIAGQIKYYNPKAILINFPNNPTGRVLSEEALREIYMLSLKNEIILINDFVYGEMFYTTPAPSALCQAYGQHFKGIVETYSMSKAYSVPGWRVGAAIGDPALISKISQIKSRIDYGIFLPFQIAAAAVLQSENSHVQRQMSIYANRLKIVTAHFEQSGFEVHKPGGGICIWIRSNNYENNPADSFILLQKLLQFGISVAPGERFGERGNGFIRVALVANEEKLNRFKAFFESHNENI
jgi:alanine-synthesizing transaminase